MSEQRLRANFVYHIRKKPATIFRHEDIFTAAVLDISITMLGITVWIEAKYGKAVKWQSELQRQRAIELENRGCAFVLLFESGRHASALRPSDFSCLAEFFASTQAELFDFIWRYIVRTVRDHRRIIAAEVLDGEK